VVGNLRSPSIVIDKGVKIEGSCTMAPVDEQAADEGIAGTGEP
jgi:cytoskeletal protein CcmA (bactofilin family)